MGKRGTKTPTHLERGKWRSFTRIIQEVVGLRGDNGTVMMLGTQNVEKTFAKGKQNPQKEKKGSCPGETRTRGILCNLNALK